MEEYTNKKSPFKKIMKIFLLALVGFIFIGTFVFLWNKVKPKKLSMK